MPFIPGLGPYPSSLAVASPTSPPSPPSPHLPTSPPSPHLPAPSGVPAGPASGAHAPRQLCGADPRWRTAGLWLLRQHSQGVGPTGWVRVWDLQGGSGVGNLEFWGVQGRVITARHSCCSLLHTRPPAPPLPPLLPPSGEPVCRAVLSEHANYVYAVAISADGRWLVSAGPLGSKVGQAERGGGRAYVAGWCQLGP